MSTSSATRIRVVHIITGLKVGGAEMMLYKLLMRTDRSRFDTLVVSLGDTGPIGARIQAAGVEVRALNMQFGAGLVRGMPTLSRWLRDLKPDVVQTWMYHADLIGGLASRFASCSRLAWGVRQSNLDPRFIGARTRLTAKACALLSRSLPTVIVSCSETARKAHIAFGYDSRKFVVLPNGFELDRFRPDHQARKEIRTELCIADSTPLIGMFARFDVQKDHRTFLAAAGALRRSFPEVQFLLCGGGMCPDNPVIQAWLREFQIENGVHLLGQREDVPKLMAALDINALSSVTEGFPNVVGEAMACGVPCVVTDAGDSRWIVGDTGLVVPVKDPPALANALAELLSEGDSRLAVRGASARKRVESNFSLDAVAAKYAGLYTQLLESSMRGVNA